MKVKKLFLLGTALCFSSGSYCSIGAFSGWRQAVESYTIWAARAGGASAVAAALLCNIHRHSTKDMELCGLLVGGALGAKFGLLSPKCRTLCAWVAGIMGASTVSYINATYQIADINAAYLAIGSLASIVLGIDDTVAIAIIGRIFPRFPTLWVAAAGYSAAYGVLNYFCAAKFGKLVIATIAAIAGGSAAFYQRRHQIITPVVNHDNGLFTIIPFTDGDTGGNADGTD
jgi:hypothetical protein